MITVGLRWQFKLDLHSPGCWQSSFSKRHGSENLNRGHQNGAWDGWRSFGQGARLSRQTAAPLPHGHAPYSEPWSLDQALPGATNTSQPGHGADQHDGGDRQLLRPLLHLRRTVRRQPNAAHPASRGQILPLLNVVHHQPSCLPPSIKPGD